MAIGGINLTLFFISVLRHHWDSLVREMYTKQPLRTGRLVEDTKGIIGNN